tara:strand:- start:2189 stop:2290 length:102 start_codon:yes stop_codon:yes gene_type:complete
MSRKMGLGKKENFTDKSYQLANTNMIPKSLIFS